MTEHAVLWRGIDRRGHDYARLYSRYGAWHVVGTTLLVEAGSPCRLDYEVVCDGEWRTRSARVDGRVGTQPLEIELSVELDGGWSVNGRRLPMLTGCVDVDLAFTPATNLIAIRRLQLDIGESGETRAAWLRFPGFDVEPLEQRYERLAPAEYRYDAPSLAFQTTLLVDEHGFVTHYPGLWEAEA